MIETRHETARGCGYRKAGGLYLVSGGQARGCGKFPLPLTICPTCSAGIHFSRSWTWIDVDKLFANKPCPATFATPEGCGDCPMNTQLFGKGGLLWVGEAFYKTPHDFDAEAARMGISRRIHTVPREFELGKTWVLFAHKKAIQEQIIDDVQTGTTAIKYTPGIFKMFKPTAIEYVVKGDETEEDIAKLEKRGITCVKVETDQLTNQEEMQL